jgi:predicted RNA-binding protein with PIN domain
MKLFVDGNDLIEAFRESRDALWVPGNPETTRANVARWLARYAERYECDVLCLFDEIPVEHVLPPTEHHGRVRVLNLDHGKEARHEIAGPANRAAQTEETLVVSADVRLATALQKGQAKFVSAADFVARTKTQIRGDDKSNYDEPDEKFSGLSDREVDGWMGFFRDKK